MEEHGENIVPKVIMNKMDLLRSDAAKETQISSRKEALSLLKQHHHIWKRPDMHSLMDGLPDAVVMKEAIDLTQTSAFLRATVDTTEQERKLES
eukprot:COSAG01_NODE_60855_length_292_cov_1.072539_1_plen_93_part_10